MWQHLSIGTATNRINLLDPASSLLLDWKPRPGDHRGSFRESPAADYRQMASYRDVSTMETFRVHVKGLDQDLAVVVTQNIRRMLRLAIDFWVQNWRTNDDLVYLSAQAMCETNRRYAVVIDGRLLGDKSPFAQPFTAAVKSNMSLIVERGPWTANAPGVGTQLELASYLQSCQPHYLSFDGSDDYVNCHSDAVLDDLINGAAMEVDGWVRPVAGWPVPQISKDFICKHFNNPALDGWRMYMYEQGGQGLVFYAYYDGAQNAWAASGTDEFAPDGEWWYVYGCIDDTGALTPIAKRPYLNINGVWVASYAMHITGVGNYVADAAEDLRIAWNGYTSGSQFEGLMGWWRLRNTISRTVGVNFDVPDRCVVPIPDANTVGIWIFEGTGLTTGNRGSGTTAGDLINGPAWGCDCYEIFGYTVEEETPPTDCRNVQSRVYNSSAIAIPNSALTYTCLTFDGERWDDPGSHSTVLNTGRLTAPTAGKYLITAHIGWETYNNGVRWVGIRLNGIAFIAQQTDHWMGTEERQTVATIFELGAGDYVEICVMQSSTAPPGNLDIQAVAYNTPEFTMHLVGCT
jgi:hypothetical protein